MTFVLFGTFLIVTISILILVYMLGMAGAAGAEQMLSGKIDASSIATQLVMRTLPYSLGIPLVLCVIGYFVYRWFLGRSSSEEGAGEE